MLNPFFSEKNQLKETLSQMQVARSSMHLHITQLESDLARMKKELTASMDAQKQLELVSAFDLL